RDVTAPKLRSAGSLYSDELDLLAACPPCQGFSRIRTRNRTTRMRDPMNRLVLDVLRLVRSLTPKYVMLENVPGLSKSVHFKKVLRGLRQRGYHVGWRVLDAARYGVPQHRRRLILLAARG